ncbi:MAG: caspase family protein [Elusimicrobiota bacterium]|nr:caspase family protein [Elusimicrobiota bacterium]
MKKAAAVSGLLLAFASAFGLSGCVTAPTLTVGDAPAVSYSEAALAESSGLVALGVCVIDTPASTGLRGGVQRRLLDLYRQRFAAAVIAPSSEKGRLCDLEARYPSPLSADRGTLHSAYTGEQLAKASGHFRSVVAMFARAVSAGTPADRLVQSQRAKAGLPPRAVEASLAQTAPGSVRGTAFGVAATRAETTPAPVSVQQGLSASDIERIARAVKGADAPAPGPGPADSAPRYLSPERANDLAVIVGIESYSDIASKAPYGERDADAFKAHVRALGVPERNIALLKGSKAGRASLVKNLEQWLPRLAKADSRVYFYFSGHGAPDVKSGQAYLVPWDGDPNFLESTAYPVAQLYRKLGELPARQVLVVLDSCFSGAGGRSVLASGARPLVAKIVTGAVPAKVTVLAASASDEISGSLDDKGHGAFTYFLLQGLDAGKTTPKALADYLIPRVQDEARRLNRDQTPQLLGDGSWALR